MRRSRVTGKFWVGDRGFPVVGAAISYAQNIASSWSLHHPGDERSFYVRDTLDHALYRVDLVRGIVHTTVVEA